MFFKKKKKGLNDLLIFSWVVLEIMAIGFFCVCVCGQNKAEPATAVFIYLFI